jgi:hypothetical protein
MFPRVFCVTAALLCAVAAAASVRRPHADFRATATLDEVAKRRENRVPPIAPPRNIHGPKSVPRTRRSAPRPQRTPVPLAITTANAPVSYTGFLGLFANFTAVPPDTTGAVGPQHVVTMLNTQMHIQSRIGGVPASVTYAGVAPGLISGVLQINAVVPAGLTPGPAVAIDLTIGSAPSPAGVTVAIR